jgi:uncharacterized SAM-binding protein YcdF (DUF218 family)
MLHYAIQRDGVPGRDSPVWLLEQRSTSTRTNAIESLKLATHRRLRRVVVVTSEFHQFRARRTFQVAARELEEETAEHPMSVVVASLNSVPWETDRRRANAAATELKHQFDFVRELAAIALYYVRGWI